ncbi:hypothetical protein HYH03_017675 [Edaphochlamys debaryana]|uniref:Peptidase M11 gametolysin domain-containing protein n=1 Tax=Edaphochlamys debaryana TaxID=47281 RepID=A0A836BQD5_9CHLO|nr:hypothetical protein HYH03_017675 [Edaphochlamys debaryana]|eukprot:KAG2483493.1 hypothetical protein HYH03_017675 [Edaphochlamys debaryana]
MDCRLELRCSIAVLIALGIALSSIGPASAQNGRGGPNANANANAKRAVSGQLVAVSVHDAEQWALRDPSNGKITPFKRNLPLRKDKNNVDLEAGAVLSANCTLDTVTGACDVTSGDLSVLQPAGTVARASTMQTLLVVILDWSACGYPPSATEAGLRSTYWGATNDGQSDGIAMRFSQCSYGQFGIDPVASRVTLLGSTAWSAYSHLTYILPPGMEGVCGWAGLALVPGRQTWLQTSSYGVYRWATVMQETIHNYGLWHSWQNGIEYNDYSTSMGRGNACPNAPELYRMGWASAVSGGEGLNSAALAAASPRIFTLGATYLTGNGAFVRVVPNWLSSYSNVNLAKNLYIGVRAAKAGDAQLGGSYAGLVNVHEINATRDNAFPSSYRNSDSRIAFVTALSPSTSTVLSSYNLVLYASSWQGADVLRVAVCRYVSSSAECPSLASVFSPNSPPPPPPAMPSPPPALPKPPSLPPPPPSPRPPSPAPPSPRPPSPAPPRPRPPTPQPPSPRPPSPAPRPPPPSPPPRPPPPSPRPPSPPPSPPKKNGNGKKSVTAPPVSPISASARRNPPPRMVRRPPPRSVRPPPRATSRAATAGDRLQAEVVEVEVVELDMP